MAPDGNAKSERARFNTADFCRSVRRWFRFLKYWSVWCWFAFGVGAYGLLDFGRIPIRETIADPNLAEFGHFAVLYFRIAEI